MRTAWPILSLIVAAVAGTARAAETPPAPAAGGAPKPISVAILDFDAALPGNPHFGAQMADILTARLSVEESLDLVERARLGDVLKEQKLKLAGLVDGATAAQVGRLVGAKLLVVGRAFVLDRKLTIVCKVIGIETGRIAGTTRQADLGAPASETLAGLADELVALIRKNADRVLPDEAAVPDPLADIRKALGDAPRPAVAIVIPESHVSRRTVDPAVETEIKRLLLACKFTVVDIGKTDLSDWARQAAQGRKPPWPAAIEKADYAVVGESSSEFAGRTGDLVTSAARAEIRVLDRRTGEPIAAERHTARAVDLAEITAGKIALQKAGRKLGLDVLNALAKRLAPEAAPGKRPAPAHGKRPAGAAKRTVFALPFDNATGQDQYDPAAAGRADLLAVLLAQRDDVAVVERQKLLTLTDEQARSLKGLTGEAYAVRAGKLLEADTVITGSLVLGEDAKLTANVKALDIATARVAAADRIAFRPEYLPEAALQSARAI